MIRPTPETDAHMLGGSYSFDGEFARRLERERDEARNQLARICKDGFDNQDTIGIETADDYVLRKLAEMREAINGAYGALSKITQVGREYYDMDMGPNGEDSLAQADAALAKLQPFLK